MLTPMRIEYAGRLQSKAVRSGIDLNQVRKISDYFCKLIGLNSVKRKTLFRVTQVDTDIHDRIFKV